MPASSAITPTGRIDIAQDLTCVVQVKAESCEVALNVDLKSCIRDRIVVLPLIPDIGYMPELAYQPAPDVLRNLIDIYWERRLNP